MVLAIEVGSIKILRMPYGCDHVSLETNIPNGAYPYDGFVSLNIDVARGSGEKYCAENFPGIPVSVREI